MSNNNYISLYNETNGTFNNLTVEGDIDFSNATVIVDKVGFGDGSATQPSIYFVNDTDTGIFRSNDNSISTTVGSIERFNVDETGANVFGHLDVASDITNSGFIVNPRFLFYQTC